MNEKSAPPNGELKIRRYLSLSKFLDLMEHKRLYFGKMSSFEDQLEGRLTFLDGLFAAGFPERLHHIVHHVWPSTLGADPELRLKAKEKTEKFQEEFKKRTFDTVFGKISLTDEASVSVIMSKQKNWLDVSCWDKNPSESIAMWKIYGGAESSVCIHTTVDALTNSINVPSNLTLSVGEVDYIDHQKAIYTGDGPLGYFMRKHLAYAYENEVRFIAYDPSANPLADRDSMGTYLPVDPERMILGITVSPEARDWFVELVRDLVVNRYGLQVSVGTSDLHKAATGIR